MNEFEFHISPVRNSSRPHTGVGISGINSSRPRARSVSSLSRCGLSTASATSGMTPPRQGNFVAEEAEAAGCAHADRAFGDHASLAARAPCWRLLDHESSLRDVDFERRVVEVGAAAMLEARRDRLEDEPVEANGVCGVKKLDSARTAAAACRRRVGSDCASC